MRGGLVPLAALAGLLQAASPVLADSPGADEFPFWPVSVKFNPKASYKKCSPTDIATPHGAATWDAQFTSCVYTLAYFDTCADDACVDAFSASSKVALNCSYDGKVGTAQEVEANRLQRCAAARRVASDRYVPESTPTAPQCTSAQLTTWDANYNQNADYNTCLQALTTTRRTRTCSDECQRVFRDAVSDADECLFSPQAGSVTQHEWFKHLLVWCIEARGDSLSSDPLLFIKGTSSPAPTTPKPTTAPPTEAPSEDASAGDDPETPEPTKPKRDSSDESSSASQEDESDGSDFVIDLASSEEEEEKNTRNPVVSPPAPGTPNYGSPNSAAVAWTVDAVAMTVAVGVALVQLL